MSIFLASFAVGFAQDGPGPNDPEDILAAQLPGGQFVDIGVNDNLGYELTVYDDRAKLIRKLDASALWAEDFVPALVCGLSKNRILVFDGPGVHKRNAVVFDLTAGKVVSKAVFAIGKVDGVARLADGSLLAKDGPDFIDLSLAGKILWKKRILIDTHGESKLSPVYDAFCVLADGSIATFQDETHRIQLWNKKFEPLKTIIMPHGVGFSFTQRMGPGKGGFWLERDLESGELVKINLKGKPSAPRKISLPDGSEISWVNFIGETSDGNPVVYFDTLLVIGPDGKLKR